MKLAIILKEALGNIRRFKELTFQSMGILAAALYLLGIYFFVEANIRNWLTSLADKVEVSCYFYDRVKEPEIKKIIDEIAVNPGVLSAKYISRNEAMINFVKDPEIGEQIKILGENPLPASVNIKLKDKSPARVAGFAAELKKDYGAKYFEDITYAEDEVRNLSSAFAWVKYGGVILGVIFFSLTLSILVFTMKIGRAERQDEMKIMKLMGGENDFIVKPFFYEGIMTGFMSFLLSLLMLSVSYYLFTLKFQIVFIDLYQGVILFVIAFVIPYLCDFIVLGRAR